MKIYQLRNLLSHFPPNAEVKVCSNGYFLAPKTARFYIDKSGKYHSPVREDLVLVDLEPNERSYDGF